MSVHPLITTAQSVIELETQAIQALNSRLNQNFVKACELIVACKGRAVVLGVGKSGHIARKITATLASTGTPACFVHPTEGLHGDLGMITPQDVALCLSHSGETEEILAVLERIKRLGIPTIAFTTPHSSLAEYSDVVIDISVGREACPLGLAPTSSTTTMLVMGDALAICLLELRGFSAEDFAKTHPGGSLGKRNRFSKIKDIMHQHEALPCVFEDAPVIDAIREMSAKKLGIALIVARNDRQQLLGVFTDGDLRRSLEKAINIHQTIISEVMNKNYFSIQENQLSLEAIRILETHKITALPVFNGQDHLVGVFNLHDLFAKELL